MTILDLNGSEIQVADLNLALIQADDFRNYSTSQPENLEFFRKQQAYWEDIYQKLLLRHSQDE